MEDQNLVCKDCGKTFVWTAGEQQFFKDKGLKNVPARCPDCRKKYKVRLKAKTEGYPVKCMECGKEGKVAAIAQTPEALCEECFTKAERKHLVQ